MDIVFSKLIVGLITVILAALGLFLDNKKNGKITVGGKLVFVLLVILGAFSIYSDLSKELSERNAKSELETKELKDSKLHEKEYRESINYLVALKDRSEKTLSRFDSSAALQLLLLNKTKKINSELEKSQMIQSQIRKFSEESLITSKNALFPIGDSIEVVGLFSLKEPGFQKQFENEKSVKQEFSVAEDCKIIIDSAKYPITRQILSDVVMLTRAFDIKITFIKNSESFIEYYGTKKLCEHSELSYVVTDTAILFSVNIVLKRKNSFFLTSILDIRNSLGMIEPGFMSIKPEYWYDSTAYKIRRMINLEAIGMVFDEKNSIVCDFTKVLREGDNFYIEKIKLKAPK